MAKLFGKELTKNEILKSVGDISQIANVRASQLTNGMEQGVDTLDFTNGTGLAFTVVVSRGMDISSASYKGMPLAWRSATGDVHPAYFEPMGLGWLRSFSGGLMTTCGLTYAGAPTVDQEEELGLHGRASNIPARNVSFGGYWEGDDYYLFAEGYVREARVFAPTIELKRRITVKMGDAKITVKDTVSNLSWKRSECMVLYHCNFGYPIVSADSVMAGTIADTKPRTPYSAKALNDWNKMQPPTPGMEEMVYYHTLKPETDGYATAGIVNTALNFGAAVRFDARTLNQLVHWKLMAEGNYVTGIEPSNCYVDGRDNERAEGRLQFLEPMEEKIFNLEFLILDGKAETDKFLSRF